MVNVAFSIKMLSLITMLIIVGCSSNVLKPYNNLENKYGLTIERNLKNPIYIKKINSIYKKGSDGFFKGKKGKNIYFRTFIHKNLEDEKAAIVISNGRTEGLIKYKELIYDLFNQGYSIYILDHRGQGFSDKIYVENPQMGHVESFEYYIEDLKIFFEKKVKINNHRQVFLLAHSMGSTIASLYIEKYLNDFHAVVLSSPLCGLKFPICAITSIINTKKVKYAIGCGDYDLNNRSFEKNKLTHSKIRYKKIIEIYKNNKEIRIGGPSDDWVYEACKATKKMIKNAIKINIPILMIQASEDEIVSKKAQRKFFLKIKNNNSVINGYVIEGAKHELFFEKDEYRIQTLNLILDFFENNL